MALLGDNSYRIHQVASNANAEIERLRAQVDNFWRKELRCLKQAGLTDGMKLLECGSGPGFFLEKVLDEYPNLRVTGVELDPFLVERSQEALDRYGGRAHLEEGSVMDLPLESDSFDFVVARLLLEHLPDPVGAAREMRRVLKPGGKIIVIDNDFDQHLRCYPEIPELDDLYQAYCACRVSQGGNPRIGRQLPVVLSNAGFADVDLEIVVSHNRLLGDRAFLKSEGTGIPAQLVRDGFLSREVFDRLAAAWHTALMHPDHSIVRQLYVAIAEKPSVSVGEFKQVAGDFSSALAAGGSLVAQPVVSRPRASLEKASIKEVLLEIWAEVLNHDDIQLDDNFFDIGGDSIFLVDVVALAQQRGLEFTPVTVFEYPTIRSLAKHLSGHSTGGDELNAVRARATKQRRALGLGTE